MTIAIKREMGDLIWIDAVIQYNRTFQSSVTKHPIETGAFITDHTIIENPVFTVSGVITDADFNLQRPVISESDKQARGWKSKQFENNLPIDDSAVEISADKNIFKRFLPESVSQFYPEQPASVSVNVVTRPKTAETLEVDLIQIRDNREYVDVVEFDGDGKRVKKIWSNCVMTNLSFEENPDSGDALWPTMTFEQVAFSVSMAVRIPQQVVEKLKNKVAPTTGKGNQSSTKQACKLESTDAPTTNSRRVSSDVSASESTVRSNSR